MSSQRKLANRVRAKASTMSSMRFICQGFWQPMKLDQFMGTLDPETTQESAASTFTSAQQEPGETLEHGPPAKAETDSEKLQDGASCSTHPGDGKVSRNSSNKFILLGKLDSARTLTNIQKTIRDIFDILTGEKDMDHLLCEDCTDKFLEQVDIQLIIESENQSYKYWMGRIREEETKTLQEELEDLELEEARLVQELKEVEKNQERIAEDLEAAWAETKMLDQQDEQYWRDYSYLQWQQRELQNELKSMKNQLRHAQIQWGRLKKTSVFSATFEIRHDGPVGIINSFRLGCLPTTPVNWKEINMAWGQTALLLLTLSNKIGLEFQRYQLIPCGNRSYLKSLTDDPIELPLFCIAGQKTCSHVKFDQTVMAFLDCMQQFKEEAEKAKWGLCLPYRIHVESGLMEDSGSSGEFYSIKTHLNTEVQWTKTLKLMLINFKCSLTWVSLRYQE
ncbi:LOW QUALITY PROTEIN: beclin-2-like [Meles meles]|uniref:LOW QUALITY PROTEIN: beclin-2-like n=1 Tax=Meles meles TaxID=9662 RepID=UPI001E69F970|nr:LOW QUALITY PROTEIN: beclin-2-like [Meles meles]